MKHTIRLIILSLLFLLLFFGIASAITGVETAYAVSEPAAMIVIGFGLIGLAEIRKKL